ncbi:MAG: ABC transporter ATP-binding protein [Alphaproteobacteria bacterium]|nr:ABC transporter ATP-binding protein [Alphaproteobacteria bacterium]
MDLHKPLSVQGVHKRFKEQDVLHGVDLSVEPGEIFGLVGLNGVGKTTIIKIILNLLNADKGNTWLFDVPVADMNSRRKMCYLPEKFIPSGYLKGTEYLSLSLAYYKRKYDHQEALALAHKLELDKKVLEQKIGKYSKGMGQKIGLMSMFMSQAPLLILDEPMSGLDPSARIQLKELLIEYGKKGNSIFFTSHILADIEEICHRIAVIHNGKIIYTGAPDAFREIYAETNLERAFLKAITSPSEMKSEV